MKTFICLLIFTIFCSCNPDHPDHPDTELPPPSKNDSDSLNVEFTFNQIPLSAETGIVANIEQNIYDLNIYVFDKDNNIKNYCYTREPNMVNIKLVDGELYNMYVISNWGHSIGSKTKADLLQLTASISNSSEITLNNGMIMTAIKTFTLNHNITIPITLQRIAAKISISAGIMTSQMIGAKIVSVGLKRCNSTMNVFSDSKISSSAHEPIYEPSNATSLENRVIERNFYVFENLQGTINSITSDKDRIEANSPENATYMWIRILHNGQYKDYRIYIGGNSTNDFNIFRNKNYQYSIKIYDNKVDARVTTTSILFYAPGEPIKVNTLYWNSSTNSASGSLYIRTGNRSNLDKFQIWYEKKSGSFEPNWSMEYIYHYPYEFNPIPIVLPDKAIITETPFYKNEINLEFFFMNGNPPGSISGQLFEFHVLDMKYNTEEIIPVYVKHRVG